MFAVIAFLCASSLSPADCSRESAIDVIPMGESSNELACQRDALQTLAGLAIEAGEGAYWKVSCQRTSIGKTVG